MRTLAKPGVKTLFGFECHTPLEVYLGKFGCLSAGEMLPLKDTGKGPEISFNAQPEAPAWCPSDCQPSLISRYAVFSNAPNGNRSRQCGILVPLAELGAIHRLSAYRRCPEGFIIDFST